jgi:hypothetical protein
MGAADLAFSAESVRARLPVCQVSSPCTCPLTPLPLFTPRKKSEAYLLLWALSSIPLHRKTFLPPVFLYLLPRKIPGPGPPHWAKRRSTSRIPGSALHTLSSSEQVFSGPLQLQRASGREWPGEKVAIWQDIGATRLHHSVSEGS